MKHHPGCTGPDADGRNVSRSANLCEAETSAGLLVQWEDAGIARRESGFESPAVHYKWAHGPTGKTPAWRAGNPGSIPGGSTWLRKVAGYGSPGQFGKLRPHWG